MGIEEIIHAVISGKLPQGVDAKTRALLELSEFQRLAPAASAALIAAARRDDFENVREWFEWALEKFGFEESYVYKLLKIGDMLLLIQDDAKLYKRLFRVSFNNLLPLTQIRIADLPAFLESLDPAIEELNRDQVRDEVRKYLGKPLGESGKKDNSGKWQPDLFQAVDVVTEMATREMYLDERFDGGAAKKYLEGGLLLIDNVISYMDTRADINPVALMEAEQLIRSEAEKLADIRQRLATGAA